MAHIIPEDAIERLATVHGIGTLDERTTHLVDIDKRIAAQLTGDVKIAWQACFPEWKAFGRVRGLSRAIRVPRYFPPYATHLGYAFAERFRDDFPFLVDVLHQVPANSVEYLCAYDLLENIVEEYAQKISVVPAQLFAIDSPVPPVVAAEINGLRNYADLLAPTVGSLLYREWQINYGDEY